MSPSSNSAEAKREMARDDHMPALQKPGRKRSPCPIKLKKEESFGAFVLHFESCTLSPLSRAVAQGISTEKTRQLQPPNMIHPLSESFRSAATPAGTGALAGQQHCDRCGCYCAHLPSSEPLSFFSLVWAFEQ